MPGIKGVKHSAKTANNDSKSDDIHDDPIYIVRTGQQTKFTIHSKKKGNPSTKSSNLISRCWNEIYHATQKWLAQSHTKSLALISKQLDKNFNN